MTDSTQENASKLEVKPNLRPKYWYLDLVLILVILVGGALRTVGLKWDEDQHLHPDERFLTMVEVDISPVNSVTEYFNTDLSSLNPQNRGHSFYVYGDFPIILVRYIAEWTGQTGYGEVNVLGRQVSTLFDLLTLIMVYILGSKLYDRRIGIIAATFYALSVIPIQLSHFFAVDTFLNFFVTVALFAAVGVYQSHRDHSLQITDDETHSWVRFDWTGLVYYILFGVALALAMASKVSAAPLAIILPIAVAGWFLRIPLADKRRWAFQVIINLSIAAVAAFILFRIFQPYAFSGPGFLGVMPNPKFMDNMRELRGLTSGAADFPPALQWARRSHTFAFENMVRWGTGLPLGIVGWLGFLWMAWRMIKGEWPKHAPIWVWVFAYFAWQSMSWNPMMRYVVLIYPAFCVIAAWGVFQLWGYKRKMLQVVGQETETRFISPVGTRISAVVILVLTIALTGLWAYAFSRIYTRPVTRIEASRWLYQNMPGPLTLRIQDGTGTYNQPLPFPEGGVVSKDIPVGYDFTAKASGVINEVELFRVVDQMGLDSMKEVVIAIRDTAANSALAEASVTSKFLPETDPRGENHIVKFNKPIQFQAGKRYNISVELRSGEALLAFSGIAPANESDWDDGLPLRIDDYDAYGGIYSGGLNFQMYWDDNEDKRSRFITTLEQADVILISSNRQWATTVRVPERYPMTTMYYRELIGCPADKSIIWCYSVAEPGMFTGRLGFTLERVFQSDPSIGNFRINDQFAEEAFTVYDHPKVMVFKKDASFNPAYINDLFAGVDLSTVIHTSLDKVPFHPQNLMLPEERLVQQRAGGTWSELFDTDALYNKYPPLAVVFWYLVLTLIGWLTFPLVYIALPGLKDRGYAFSRITGMLIISLLVWLAGSFGIPFNTLTISAAVVILAGVSACFAWMNRLELTAFIRNNKRQIFVTEAVLLGFFIFDLLIRIGNPDLWHPYKGGEKPMDFSYFNAVLKSTSFPPYDPWFAGGYINYYYYGFVIVGVLVKWLGIVPSIAYNIILPTLFSLLAVGAFSIIDSVASEILSHKKKVAPAELQHAHPDTLDGDDVSEDTDEPEGPKSSFWFALLGAIGLTTIGNLGTLRLIWHSLQRLAAPDGNITGLGITFFTRMKWTFEGLLEMFSGARFPLYPGDWYWIPSRAIPAPNDVEPITEFPFFTFLYADMHAHMIALPITLLVIAWVVSLILSKGQPANQKGGQAVASVLISLFVGALAVGALRPTNTWDFPVYLVLCFLGIVFTVFRWRDAFSGGWLDKGILQNRWVRGALLSILFGIMAILLYQPFSYWYGAGYNAVELWKGGHTPSWSYFTHWGLFLFIIVTWLSRETIDWMASTPLRKLAYLRPYLPLIGIFLTVLVAVLAVLLNMQIWIAWFVIPTAAWAAILLFRPGTPDIKRMFLFFTGTGLVLTLFVEIVVLKGDIGRMNTVFKFYLQVWTLFSLTSAAAMAWLLKDMRKWSSKSFSTFTLIGLVLFLSAMLFPVMGGLDKIRDRYVKDASHSLDGMTYMNSGATYLERDINWDQDKVMDLSQDYQVIRWMQENIAGSPVIVEGYVSEYRWGARYTINTGLPAVLGWNWHQRQQRGVVSPEWVTSRADEINAFYSTEDINAALEFIQKYDVSYIIVGQMENAIYPLAGLAKFEMNEGRYWKAVYSTGETTLYQIIKP